MKNTTNVFSEGMDHDKHPLTTSLSIMTDALNATLVTYNGNDLMLQNDMGNTMIQDTKTGNIMGLREGFIPVGVKEHGGIIYIASVNKDGISEIGTIPSPVIRFDIGEKETLIINSNLVFKSENQSELLDITKYKLSVGEKFAVALDINLRDVVKKWIDINSTIPTNHYYYFISTVKYDNNKYQAIKGLFKINLYAKGEQFYFKLGNIDDKIYNYILKQGLVDNDTWFYTSKDKHAASIDFDVDAMICNDLVETSQNNNKIYSFSSYPNVQNGSLAIAAELEKLIDFSITKNNQGLLYPIILYEVIQDENSQKFVYTIGVQEFEYSTDSAIHVDSFQVSLTKNNKPESFCSNRIVYGQHTSEKSNQSVYNVGASNLKRYLISKDSETCTTLFKLSTDNKNSGWYENIPQTVMDHDSIEEYKKNFLFYIDNITELNCLYSFDIKCFDEHFSSPVYNYKLSFNPYINLILKNSILVDLVPELGYFGSSIELDNGFVQQVYNDFNYNDIKLCDSEVHKQVVITSDNIDQSNDDMWGGHYIADSYTYTFATGEFPNCNFKKTVSTGDYLFNIKSYNYILQGQALKDIAKLLIAFRLPYKSSQMLIKVNGQYATSTNESKNWPYYFDPSFLTVTDSKNNQKTKKVIFKGNIDAVIEASKSRLDVEIPLADLVDIPNISNSIDIRNKIKFDTTSVTDSLTINKLLGNPISILPGSEINFDNKLANVWIKTNKDLAYVPHDLASWQGDGLGLNLTISKGTIAEYNITSSFEDPQFNNLSNSVVECSVIPLYNAVEVGTNHPIGLYKNNDNVLIPILCNLNITNLFKPTLLGKLDKNEFGYISSIPRDVTLFYYNKNALNTYSVELPLPIILNSKSLYYLRINFISDDLTFKFFFNNGQSVVLNYNNNNKVIATADTIVNLTKVEVNRNKKDTIYKLFSSMGLYSITVDSSQENDITSQDNPNANCINLLNSINEFKILDNTGNKYAVPQAVYGYCEDHIKCLWEEYNFNNQGNTYVYEGYLEQISTYERTNDDGNQYWEFKEFNNIEKLIRKREKLITLKLDDYYEY